MRRGISPVIATVIIVAVAIAISIAVAGWLMGLWGTFGTTEQIQVLPNTTLTVGTTNTLHLCVKNTGSKTATVNAYEIAGVTGGSVSLGNNTMTLKPGQTNCVDVTVTGTVTPGAQYLVKVYTDSGGVYQGYVVAQSG